MVKAQLLVAASENTDLMDLPAFQRALTYVTVEPLSSFGCVVARNRSDLAGRFLSGECDVGVCVDPDVAFTELLLSKVVNRARETRGIAGGTYSHKILGYNVVPKGGHSGEMEPQSVNLGPKSMDGPLEVDAVPSGLMAVHRDVFLAIPKNFPELITPLWTTPVYWFRERRISIPGGSYFLSCDYSFCSYARDSGCKVELVPSAVAGHKGKPWWEPFGSEPEEGFKKFVIGGEGV